MENQLTGTLDWNDTFLNIDHLKSSFPGHTVRVKTNSPTVEPRPPFRWCFCSVGKRAKCLSICHLTSVSFKVFRKIEVFFMYFLYFWLSSEVEKNNSIITYNSMTWHTLAVQDTGLPVLQNMPFLLWQWPCHTSMKDGQAELIQFTAYLTVRRHPSQYWPCSV